MRKYLIITTIISTILFPDVYIVLDENNNPIENVQVYNNSFGTISDSNGTFNLSEDCLSYRLNYIGFQSAIINPCESTTKKIILYKSPIVNKTSAKIKKLIKKPYLKSVRGK